jgi:hypothetical protein
MRPLQLLETGMRREGRRGWEPKDSTKGDHVWLSSLR